MTTSPLPAGDFSEWLIQFGRAADGDQDATVTCGTCTACCASSQFVHVGPDETDAIAHIPKTLLFPAPGLPTGYKLMGYDEHGRCPMLSDDGCSIYDHRPRTCRTYDCRVLPAAGLEIDPSAEPHKAAIAAQARRWRFTYSSKGDLAAHDAIRALARRTLADKPSEAVTAVAVRAATAIATPKSEVLVSRKRQK